MFVTSYWRMIQRTSRDMNIRVPDILTMENDLRRTSSYDVSVTPGLINTKLPTELLNMIFMRCYDYIFIKEPFSNIRLVCKTWETIITPILLERTTVIPHLMCLDRLMLDIRRGNALRLHIKHLTLNVHGFVDIGLLLIEAYQTKGYTRGLTEPRYVQPQRNKRVQEQEIEALLLLFKSLPNLQSVCLNLDENHDSGRPDDWDNGPLVGRVMQWLDFDEWNEFEYLDRRNYHYENPPALYSIIFALAECSWLEDLTLERFNIVRLVKGQYEDEDRAMATLDAIISRQERLSLVLDFQDYLSEFNEIDYIDQANHLATHGPGTLIQQASQCKELCIQYSPREHWPGGDETHKSQFMWTRQVTTTPTFPHLTFIHLMDSICTPKDLLQLLTFHSPSLRELYMYNVSFVSDSTAGKNHIETWTRFFKQLKASTTLTKLEFNTLFTRANIGFRNGMPLNHCLYPDFYPRERLPAIYTETIAWFLDRGLGDDECPLNRIKDMKPTDLWADGILFRCRYGEDFRWGTFQM